MIDGRRHQKIHLDLAIRLGHMRMRHEHNEWLSVAESVGSYRGDDGTRDVEQRRKAERNDPPWQPLLRCIYECTVGGFIANGVTMAGPVGLTASKEGGEGDPGIEDNRVDMLSFTLMDPRSTSAGIVAFLIVAFNNSIALATPIASVCKLFMFWLNIRAQLEVAVTDDKLRALNATVFVYFRLTGKQVYDYRLLFDESSSIIGLTARKQGTESRIRTTSHAKRATSVTGPLVLKMTGLNKLREGLYPAFDGEVCIASATGKTSVPTLRPINGRCIPRSTGR
ncbi:hypothetical protein EDD18DRAFT_1113838 [Armillaria luteobubalina]|uniref:Uncharacterized protein n=1 Tax=Armillaria luteobubalina TaxID=153913 RepID=A0AA39U7U1_9AGAR|nr:hypothetical protein EDD18DRAFT_1113838 [Armillaria luteobubalina]